MAKFSTKINSLYIVTTGLIIITMAVTMYFLFETQSRKSIDNDLIEYSEFLMTGLNTDLKDMTELFEHLFSRKELPTHPTKMLHFVLASSDSLIFETNTFINLDKLFNKNTELSQTTMKSSFRTINFNNTEYRVYSKPIKLKNQNDFQLIIITSLDRLNESLSGLRIILIIICPIAMLIAGFLGLMITKKALNPIAELTKTAASISSENLNLRVPVINNNDELDNLAKTFNSMIDRIDKSIKSQQRFIADVSHDIRTPLTIIQIELDLLTRMDINKQNLSATINKCLKEIHRLDELTNNLLFLARADAQQLELKLEKVRFDELILDNISRVNNLAKQKGITFRINFEQAYEVFLDVKLFSRAIINILDNAIKYSLNDGIIDISLYQEESTLILMIKNNGEIINQEMISNVFDRFNRAGKSR